MKFVIGFKTPDASFELKKNYYSEKDTHLLEEIEDIEEKFVEYGEYISIEFDTETMSAIVLKAKI